jgi:hypothetical protein
VQVVGERLGPILGGMHGRIRRHVEFFPAVRRALAVMPVQRLLIVGVGVTEQLAEPRVVVA